jgi:Catalase
MNKQDRHPSEKFIAANANAEYLTKAFIFTIATTILAASFLGPIALAGSAWTSPQPTEDPIHTPAEVVESMHSAFGYVHFRAVHAKGIILEGNFTPDPNAKKLTKAPHLQGPSSKVTVRFSNYSGVPTTPDNSPAANPRGMGIRFQLPGGSSTDLVAHSFNGFPVSNSDDFRELMLAMGASGPCATTPTALDEFLDLHPIAKKFFATEKTPASFATISYFGVNSFKFVNAKGEAHFVRYQLVPENGEVLLTDEERQRAGCDYIMDEIKSRVAEQPIVFELYAQLAEDGDKIDDPSIAWPDSRKRVLLGRIEINKLTPNTVEEDKSLVFVPSNVPAGIQIADSMVTFSSKIYRLASKDEREIATTIEK